MTAPTEPRPGEIWLTALPNGSQDTTEYRATGWHWPVSGARCSIHNRKPIRRIGFTAPPADRKPQDVLREAALIVSTHGIGYSAGVAALWVGVTGDHPAYPATTCQEDR
ncbi:hypothetical protein MYK68_14070 [Gordonia sp. PP30]|uniref:hypothetical protein n=1 Tax=Gordonia sp. PP30 TaxID=2935861 RepID=UPI001FFF23D7|nr:hypothetical protein [Gordonia sp. PP30]UQE73857.1 hypothetical protein MYK68_14070 [Gordonia sp. PP30]